MGFRMPKAMCDSRLEPTPGRLRALITPISLKTLTWSI